MPGTIRKTTCVAREIRRQLDEYEHANKEGLRGLPENFHKSRLYRDALCALSGSLVPAGRPYNETDLFNIVNVLEIIFALSLVLNAMHNQPEDVRHTICTDIIPALWDWVLFFHPDADNIGEALMEDALWRYSHRISPGMASIEYVHNVLATFFYTIVHSKEAAPPAFEIPDFTSYLYDLWRHRARRLGDNQPPDTLTNGILISLADCGFTADLRLRISNEMLAKDPTSMHALVRRLRCIIRMSKPDLEELAYQVDLIHNMAINDAARPLLRGAFSLMGPAMRMYDLAVTDTYHNIGDGQLHNNPTSAADYLRTCCEIITLLRDEVRSSRDVVRLVKGGIMRELYNYMRRLPDVLSDTPHGHPALWILYTIISPAAALPSVSNAISNSIERDDLRSRLPSLVSVSNWALRWDNLFETLKITRMWTTQMRNEAQAAHCHSQACPNTGGRLRRCPCGQTYYCSAGCQAEDWPSHKPDCRIVQIAEGTEAKYALARPSDVHFMQFYALNKARKEGTLPSQGNVKSIVVDVLDQPQMEHQVQPVPPDGHVWLQIGIGNTLTVLDLGKR